MKGGILKTRGGHGVPPYRVLWVCLLSNGDLAPRDETLQA